LPRSDAPGLHDRAVTAVAASTALHISPCSICGATEARPRFAIEGLASRVVACAGCGLGSLYPLPSEAEIRAFYPDDYYGEPGVKFRGFVEGLVRWIGTRHLGFLSQGLPRGARILDVGCGRGVILGALADRGFEVHGQEISAQAARGADPRAEIRIAPSLVDAGYAAESFDQIVIWHVLEHLRDPRATLAEAQRISRRGARLIVAVPNFASLQAEWSGAAWFHLDLPRHLYQFPLGALRQLLERTGFEVASEHHFSLRQNPFGWIQSAMNRAPGLPRNGLYQLLHERPPGGRPPYTLGMRNWLRALFLLGAAPALAMTLLDTWRSCGATVHLVVTRK
jgi:SAM-dependent methyltransferase